MTTVVLMGGGMDSYAVLLYLKSKGIEDIIGLHIKYGQRASSLERQTVRKQCDFHGVTFVAEEDEGHLIYNMNPQGSILFGDRNAPPMIYGRNLVLLMIAAQYGNSIYLGLDKPFDGGVPYFDCTLDYFQQAIKLTGRPDLTVAAPFVEVDKLDVCKASIQVDPNFFDHFMSCWLPKNGQECGECKHCQTKATLKEQAYQYLCEQAKHNDCTFNGSSDKPQLYESAISEHKSVDNIHFNLVEEIKEEGLFDD